MTLATTTSRVSYNGDASTTAFSFGYKYISASDLKVYLVDEDDGTETLQSNYTVTATGSATNGVYPGATITFTTAPAADKKVVIFRDPALTQNFDFDAEADPLPVITRHADNVAMLQQRIANDYLRLPNGALSGSSGLLPNMTGEAGKAIIVNSDENGYTYGAGVDGVSVSSTVEGALAAASKTAFNSYFGNDVYYAENYGVVADGTTDNTSALNALYVIVAAAGGGVIEYPIGTILCTGQVTCDGSYITHRGSGRKKTIIHSTYTSAPCFVLGNSSTQTVEYHFEDIGFTNVAGGTYFWTKYVRGLYLTRIYEKTDRFLRLGDSSAGTGKPTYIVHWDDCPDSSHLAGSTPTLHHIYAENFLGQWSMVDTYVEGQNTSGLDGFYASDNIQTRIDHFVVVGGYFGRFRDNYSFVDARIVNLCMTAHVCELASRNAIRLEVTTSTSKNVANVGWEKLQIDGSFSSTGGNAIFVQCERASVGTSQITFGNLVFPSDNVQTPIYIQGQLGDVTNIIIANVNVVFTPTNTSQRIVHIVGGSAVSTTVRRISIGRIAGRAITNALAAVVRLEGRISEITPPCALAVTNATLALDDQTGATAWKLFPTTVSTQDFFAINDASTAWTRPIKLDALAAFVEPGFIYGLTLSNNGSDATNDIDIAAGKCVDSTNSVLISCAAMTKRLDADWAAGTGNGMRNSAAAITDTTYHIFVAAKVDGTQDYYAHTSSSVSSALSALQLETGGGDYIYLRRIGSIIRSGGTILAFTQRGDEFLLKVPVAASDSANPGTSAISKALTTPAGIQVDAIVTTGGVDSTPAAATYGLVTALDQTDTVPTSALFSWSIAATGAGAPNSNWANLRVRTDISSQIRLRVDASTADLTLRTVTHGWIDTRGRLA